MGVCLMVLLRDTNHVIEYISISMKKNPCIFVFTLVPLEDLVLTGNGIKKD